MFTVEAHLPWMLETFRPDLVLYDAGVDPHWEDELGRLRLTDQGELFSGAVRYPSPQATTNAL